MLCPKCGFISFDHSSVCGKCHNDLSATEAELRGTVADVAGHFFLGGLVKDASGRQGADEVAVSSTVEVPLAPGEAETAGDETLIIDEGEGGPEEAGALFSADESPALEFDLDEIPHLEGAERERMGGAEQGVEMPLPPGAAPGLSVLAAEEEGELASAPQQPGELIAAAPPALELDVASLTLDSGDEVSLPPAEEAPADDDQPGQMTIDLNSIDLSDLVHPGAESAGARRGAAAPGGEGLELDDTMDLSLIDDDATPAPPTGASPVANADDLKPVDLSLVDDALEDLVAAPARQETAPPATGGDDVLELSMEESGK